MGGGKHADVSSLRCMATAMIVICHMLQYYDNELCRWFNVGVQIFFTISGFLYGTKDIPNPISFIAKSFKKILIPYYTFLILAVLIYFIFYPNYLTISNTCKSFLCASTIKGLGHLWFVGYILFCYLITPYLYWLRKLIESYPEGKKLIIYCLLLLLYQIISVAFNCYFIPDRISCFIIGFFLADILRWTKKYKLIVQSVIIILAISLNSIEILGKYICSDIVGIFGSTLFNVIIRYAHCLLGVFAFILFKQIFVNVKYNRLLRFSDNYSYPIYLVHLLVILSPFTLMSVSGIPFINWIIVVISIIILGVILKTISDYLSNKIMGL